MNVLARCGWDQNWCPVNYQSLREFQSRFNLLSMGFNVSKAEFLVKTGHYRQHPQLSYSILIESELDGNIFMAEYADCLLRFMQNHNLPQANVDEEGRFYGEVGGNYFNDIPDQATSRVYISKFPSSPHIFSIFKSFVCFFSQATRGSLARRVNQ